MELQALSGQLSIPAAGMLDFVASAAALASPSSGATGRRDDTVAASSRVSCKRLLRSLWTRLRPRTASVRSMVVEEERRSSSLAASAARSFSHQRGGGGAGGGSASAGGSHDENGADDFVPPKMPPACGCVIC